MTLVAPLAGLSVIALVLWVVATALAIALVMQYIGDAIRAVPVAGPYIAGAVDKLAQAITSAAGKLESGIDHLIGAAWHTFARYLDFMWHQFEAQAATAWHVANALVPIASWIHRIESLARHSLHSLTAVLPRIKTLEHEYRGIERQLKTLEHEVGKGIGEDVLPRIRSLDRELSKVEHKVIPALAGEVATAENDVTQLAEYVRANYLSNAKTAVEAAVTVALAGLGLGGLSCSNFKSLLGKYACGLGKLLDDLLGIVIAGLVLESVCEFLPLLEDAFGAVIGPATALLNDVPLGACEQPPASWSHLSVAAGPLPPAQTLGTFGS